jgi:hypothetical protein
VRSPHGRLALLAISLLLACEGPTGPQGPSGPVGPAGNPGPALPSGSTVRGLFGAGFSATAAAQGSLTTVSFGFTLSAAPAVRFIPLSATPPAECPGTGANPQAAAGYLCVYEVVNLNVTNPPSVCTLALACGAAMPWGFVYVLNSLAAGLVSSRGTWAVTAP